MQPTVADESRLRQEPETSKARLDLPTSHRHVCP
jgi:hypothetical protein